MSDPAHIDPDLAWIAVDVAMTEMSRNAHRLGRALRSAQLCTAHGDWTKKLDERGISPRTAQRAIQIAQNMTEDEFIAAGSIRGALAQIVQPSADDARAAVPDGVTHPSPSPGQRSSRHPATWDERLISAAAEMIEHHTAAPGILIDPMAGEGSHYAPFAEAGWTVIMSDIHLWPHRDRRVLCCDAADISADDDSIDVLLTSPPFGNRLADKMSTDDDQRVTYADRRGADAAENDASGMQWGAAYRSAMRRIWTEAARLLKDDGLAVIDIKDHIRGGSRQHVTAWTIQAWRDLGWTVADIIPVQTGHYAGISHAEKRTDGHSLIAFSR